MRRGNKRKLTNEISDLFDGQKCRRERRDEERGSGWQGGDWQSIEVAATNSSRAIVSTIGGGERRSGDGNDSIGESEQK